MRSFAIFILCVIVGASGTALRGQESAEALQGRTLPPGVFREGPSRLVAEGSGYRALLERSGIAVESYRGEANGSVPRLELRFAGAWRGGIEVVPGDEVAPEKQGLTSLYRRGPLVERYLARGRDVEQSFEITAPLPGSGDLVLRYSVGGDVQANAFDRPRHAPVEFRRDGRPALRFGEAWAFDRAGRRVDVLTSWDGAGTLELVVPASLLDKGRYPLLVDPAIGPILTPGGSAFNDVNADVAYSPADGTYLVVWERIFGTFQRSIRAARYDGDGNLLGGLISVRSGTVVAQTPTVAYYDGGSTGPLRRFLVVWSENVTTSTTQLRGRLVRADDGTFPAVDFAITNPATDVKDLNPTVAGGPPMCVAWERRAPGATTANTIACRTLHWPVPSVANFVSLELERTIETVPGSGYVRGVRLAKSSLRPLGASSTTSFWRAVWQRWFTSPAPGDFDVRTATFQTTSGSTSTFTIQSGPAGIPGAADIGDSETTPDLAVLGTRTVAVTQARYLVAWAEGGDVFASLFDPAGTIGGVITVEDSPLGQFEPAVGAGACEFTVGFLQAGAGEFNLDIFARRVLPDGTVGIASRLVDDPGSVFQSGLRASSRPLLDNDNFRRNTSLLTWTGGTGSSTGGNQIRARFFEPLQGVAAFYGVSCSGPGGSLPVIGVPGGAPHPGNASFAIDLTGAPPFAPAILVLGTTAAEFPIPGTVGCFAYVGPSYLFLPATADATGSATIPQPVPCQSTLETGFFSCQWLIATPGFNGFGYITSNDVDLFWND